MNSSIMLACAVLASLGLGVLVAYRTVLRCSESSRCMPGRLLGVSRGV